MIEITIDDRAVRQALEALSRRVADMTPAMHAMRNTQKWCTP